jgi:hypothetical protein
VIAAESTVIAAVEATAVIAGGDNLTRHGRRLVRSCRRRLGLRSAGVSLSCNSRVARARGHVITARTHQFGTANRKRLGAPAVETCARWSANVAAAMLRARTRRPRCGPSA